MKWVVSNPEPAQITAVEGAVELQRAGGEIVANAVVGLLIKLGDRIKTGPQSSAAIRFADNTELRLRADSIVRFDLLRGYGETGMVDSRLRVLRGRTESQVQPATGPGSRFEIGTPSAVSAVRGTEYRVSVTGEGNASTFEVLSGGVTVSGADKKTVVNSGFGTRVAAGAAPLSPRKLLEPPLLDEIPRPVQRINWPLTWQPLPGALQYRIEIAETADFRTLRWQHVGPRTRVALPDLPDGSYFIRLRGADDLGLEGRDVTREILLDARPQPPVPLRPRDGEVLRGKGPALQWTDSAEAARYKLEIARDREFTDLVVDRDDLKGTRVETADLAMPATYYWRLASFADDGELGPYSVSRSWEIKPIPDSVDAKLGQVEEGRMFASWPPGAADQSYQVQLAYDPQFSELQLDEMTSTPEISFDQIKGRARYLRVRAIEPDGYQGPWGATQRVAPLPDRTWIIPFSLSILILLLL